MSEDEDYMSDRILSQWYVEVLFADVCESSFSPDVRPGVVGPSLAKRYRMDKRREEANVKNRQLKTSELERSTLESGLKTALPEDNKGYALLKKMGFKPGSSIGKRAAESNNLGLNKGPLKEPLPVTLKVDRSGLGHSEEIARKARAKLEDTIAITRTSQTDFIARKREAEAYRTLTKDLRMARKACYDLDCTAGVQTPVMTSFWPKGALKLEDEEEPDVSGDRNPTAQAKLSAEEITSLLKSLIEYLRKTYFYCLWCSVRYEGPVKPDAARYYCNVAGGEIGHNLIYLGKKGMFTSASGLTVAYLSGFESEYEDEFHFSEDTVDRLIASITSRPNFSGIDILLTSQWPQGVEHLSPVAPDVYEEEDLRSSMLITKLAAALRPRYHFSANTGCHFERPPYRNSSLVARQPGNTTRFVGLSRCGNPSKLKYLFAFNIIPFKYLAPGQATEESAVTTEFPYTETLQELEIRKEQKKQKKPNENIRGRQFFFDFASVEASGAPDNEQGSRQVKVGALSHSEVEKHLIVSISDNAYLSLTKGGLCDDHFLISSIGHVQSISAADDEIKEEVEQYKSCLKRYFEDQGKCVVFFERNYRTQHMQVHAVPLPADKAVNIRACFLQTAANHGFELMEVAEDVEISEVVNPGCPYFYAELPYGQKLLVLRMRQFPVHFAREALTHKDLLNCPEKVDWHNCALTVEEETQLALKFRDSFSKYDFNQVLLP
ncbi:g-patch domain protein [Trichuris suis]|nr:g-patch domain protein [Trichuris suis]